MSPEHTVEASTNGHSRAGASGAPATAAQDENETSFGSAPEPDFEVISARAVRHAAVPTLALDVHVSEPSGRAVFMVALHTQVMIEPARRQYDAATRERLEGLFGPPERWAVTTRALQWVQRDIVVPAFTGSTTVTIAVECSYDMEVAAAKYLYSLPDGEAPLALHFSGIVYYPGDEGALQMVLLPWSRSVGFRMPVSAFRDAIEDHYPGTGWIALREETLATLERERVARALPTMDACVLALLGEGTDG